MTTDLFTDRRFILQWIVVAIVLIYISRLFYLQVVNDDYKQLAESNALRAVTVFPARGLVYDRNGQLIIDNQKEYDLWVIPGQVKALDTLSFCELVGVSDSLVEKKLSEAAKYSRYKPSLFLKGISVEQFAAIQEELYLFPGFYGQVRTIRSYPYKCGAPIFGYISEVSPSQIEKSDGYYRMGDYIGTSGIEQSYEKILRGIKGIRYMVVDVHNREQGSFNDGVLDTLAVPGKNLISGLDVALQQYGEQLMKNKIGSIVAIEPSTGEILCMISSPGYDPSMLTGMERGKNFKQLVSDSLKPLYVRPIKAAYPPGSTYKSTLALIGLQQGAVSEFSPYSCAGGYYVGALRVGCHHSGYVSGVVPAIQYSCNAYFCNYFRKLIDDAAFQNVAQGLDFWKAQLAAFGIGVKTGVDVPNEGYGFVPDSKYYDRIYGVGKWNSVTVISLGIGQGEIGETPLQMANVMATIANRGYWYTPHFIREIVGDDSSLNKMIRKNMVPVDTTVFSIVIRGMEQVVEAGTATIAKIPGVSIAGKTGTAQNPKGKDNSLFVAFAPVANPKIAIACVVENAGWGGAYAAPIASLMLEKYLNDTISSGRKYIEQNMIEAVLIPGL